MGANPFDNQNAIELDEIDLNNYTEQILELGNSKSASLFKFTSKSDLTNIIPGTICSVISALGYPAQTIIYGRIFQKLSDFYIISYDDFRSFILDVGKYCVMIIVIGAVKLVFTFLSIMFWMRNGENHQRRVRKQIFSKIMVQENIEWVENFKNITGEVNQLNRCIEEVRTGNAEVLALFSSAIVSCLALFMVAMVFSWSVTLVTLALTPVFAVLSFFTGKIAYKYSNKENTYSSQSSKVINWCLSQPANPRWFNGKDQEVITFKNLINRCSSNNYKVENIIGLNMGVLRTLSMLMFVQAFWFGITMIRLRRVGIDNVFTSFAASLMLAGAVASVADLFGDIYRAQAAVGKLVEFLLLNNNTDSSRLSHRMSPTWCNGDIEFQNVQFHYKNKEGLVLRDLSLKVKANEFNYIIGKSGSGKSTISQVIMGFYNPDSGRVLIDGIDAALIDKSWIISNISLIQLNPIIFNLSLKLNLAMSVLDKYKTVDDVPDHLITDACEFAQLSKLVAKLGGIDASINNMNLSGGEKQRISIARAKLRDSSILMIDEGFSALDHATRDPLLSSIKEWRQGKTTIFITHQLDQIDPTDYVMIIQDGHLKNQGLYSQLQGEPLISSAANSPHLNRQASSFDDSSVDKDYYSDTDSYITTNNETKRGSQIKNYNYLKNPALIKDLEGAIVDSDVKIYSLFRILFYCIKTVNSKMFIFVGLIFAAIHAVTNPLFSYIFGRLLDNMVDTSIGINASSDLKQWSCIIIGIAIANGVSYYLSHFLLAVSAESWVNQLRKQALIKINDQDLSFFNGKNSKASTMNSLLMNDTRDLRTMISKFLSVTITLTVLLLLGNIFALVIGWRLALTGLAFAVLVLIISAFFSRVLQKKETSYKDKVADLEAVNYELVNGIKTVHSLNLKEYFYSEFDEKARILDKAANRRNIQTGLSVALKDFVTSVATGILMYYGMRLVGRRQYERLQFMQVITLILMTFTTAGDLINQLPDITRGQRCATYIMNLLNMPDSPVEVDGNDAPTEAAGVPVLNFSGVTFSYTSGKPALKDASFKVSKGEIFGVFGESGSGKSTIISLITRLYGNYKGTISLNGSSLDEVNPEYLRSFVSIVPQSPVFFEGTIYDNLVYGLSKEKLVSTSVDQYLKLCNIESFTNSLPEGLQTNIGALTENALISTGQLQRLAMVRALIRKPKVLILDECTSNLDTQNFNLFKSLIVTLNKELGITILLVSHDPELLSISNNSIHLNSGKIIN